MIPIPIIPLYPNPITQAITSTQVMIESLNERQIEEFLWPLWLRLSSATFFISKASAASLTASIYPKLSFSAEKRAEMRRVFGMIGCGDECPIVRRAAAPILSKLIEAVKPEGKGNNSSLQIVFSYFFPPRNCFK